MLGSAKRVSPEGNAIFETAFVALELRQSPRRAASGEHGDDVDGFGDEGARDRDDCFLHKLLKPPQRAQR